MVGGDSGTQSKPEHATPEDRNAQPPRTSPGSGREAESILKSGGLYDDFMAYHTPTDAEYRAVLTEGMIVLDTNVLLDLYRHNKQACDGLLSVLDRLKERLWIPHQVMKEFWHNREDVLQDKRGTVKITQTLKSQSATAVGELYRWARGAALAKEHPAELAQIITNAFEAVVVKVAGQADPDTEEYAQDTNKDPILSMLTPILAGRVGPPFDEKEHEKAVEEAKRRGRDKRPPGFRDVGPDGKGPTGDCVLWLQLLAEARNRHKDVLFVTGDNKDDWWRFEGKDEIRRGPRPELAEELRAAARTRLFMLRPEEMLSRASQVLNVDVPNETVEEVKRVSSRAFVSWRTAAETSPTGPRRAGRCTRTASGLTPSNG